MELNSLEREFVPYEEALALKELGLDEPCLGFFDINKKLAIRPEIEYLINHEKADYVFGNSRYPLAIFLAPTYQQAFRWFEKVHAMFIERRVDTTPNEVLDIVYHVKSWRFTPEEVKFEAYDSFDANKANLACLRHLIKILKLA